jgi:hypothetical protein
MVAAADNPKGFWEEKRIVDCHTDLMESVGSFFDDFFPMPEGWENRPEIAPHRDRLITLLKTEFTGKPLWGFKDPRTCRLLALWHGLFDELKVSGRFVLVRRHPDEVAASLESRNGQAYNKSLLMSLSHLLEAERGTRGRRRVVVSYDQLLADWTAVAGRIGTELAIDWPNSPESIAAQFNQFLDADLRHHRTQKPDALDDAIRRRGADPRIARWTFAADQALAAEKIDTAALDRISDEFAAARSWLNAWRPVWSMDERYLATITTLRSREELIQKISGECQTLRNEAAAAKSHAAAAEDAAADHVAKAQSHAAEMELRAREIQAQAWASAAEAKERVARAQSHAAEMELRAKEMEAHAGATAAEAAERVARSQSHAAAMEARAAEMQSRAAESDSRAEESELRASESESHAAESEARADKSELRANTAESRAHESDSRARAAEARAAAAEQTIDDIYRSLSWELTTPLRYAGRLVNRLKGKSAPLPKPRHSGL